MCVCVCRPGATSDETRTPLRKFIPHISNAQDGHGHGAMCQAKVARAAEEEAEDQQGLPVRRLRHAAESNVGIFSARSIGIFSVGPPMAIWAPEIS